MFVQMLLPNLQETGYIQVSLVIWCWSLTGEDGRQRGGHPSSTAACDDCRDQRWRACCAAIALRLLVCRRLDLDGDGADRSSCGFGWLRAAPAGRGRWSCRYKSSSPQDIIIITSHHLFFVADTGWRSGRLSGCKGRDMSRRPPEGWSPFFNRRSWRLPWPALTSLLCGDRAPAARVPAARPGWRRSWQIELRLRLTAGAACWAREMELPPQVIIATRHHHRHKSSSFLCGGYRVALETFGLRWYLCHFYLHPWWRYLNTFLALTLTALSSNMTNCYILSP